MSNKHAWSWAAVVALAATTASAAPVKNDPGLNAYQKFNSGPPTVAPEPPAKPKPKAPDSDAKARETAAAIKAQEEAHLFRRLAVCDKLKQVALEKGDRRLEDEAIRLEERATEVFKLRTAHLQTAKPAKTGPRGDKP